MKSMFRDPRPRERARVAIVGGGVSGVTAAFRCAQYGYDTTVFEADARLGGSLWSEQDQGFLIEHGAESFDAGSEAVRALAEDLRLTSEIVPAATARSYGFDGHSLFVLDPGSAGASGASASSPLGRSVATFGSGMGRLVEGLASALATRGEIHLNTPIKRLEPTTAGWRLHSARGPGGDFDAVVIASDARTASRLLSELFGSPALALRSSRSVPIVSVSLAFAREAIAHPLDATGFITGFGVELDDCVKCSFVSSTFHGRAPDGSVLVRIFLRPNEADLEAPLELFRERATKVAMRVLEANAAPQRAWEARWREGFAVLDEEQLRRVALLEYTLGRMPIALAGTAFHGDGVDGAVRSADNAARKLRRLC
ncbi:MAG TPA: FAD-dependent oxidoreductase [Polyangiaceae bacterium]|nr:FAD-dependent oxidoreductase [Polyangiaceae bacterium]